MKLALIVAMTKDGLIGKGGGLPWPRCEAPLQPPAALAPGVVYHRLGRAERS